MLFTLVQTVLPPTSLPPQSLSLPAHQRLTVPEAGAVEILALSPILQQAPPRLHLTLRRPTVVQAVALVHLVLQPQLPQMRTPRRLKPLLPTRPLVQQLQVDHLELDLSTDTGTSSAPTLAFRPARPLRFPQQLWLADQRVLDLSTDSAPIPVMLLCTLLCSLPTGPKLRLLGRPQRLARL